MNHQDVFADPPSRVHITVIADSSARVPATRTFRIIGAGAVLACALGAGALALAALVPHGIRASRSAAPRTGGPAAVAAAYEYPLRCLAITIAADDPSYASAKLDRASPCWRYGAYGTTVFHWMNGAWRRVMSAESFRCPIASLPVVVERELALCPLGAGPWAGWA